MGVSHMLTVTNSGPPSTGVHPKDSPGIAVVCVIPVYIVASGSAVATGGTARSNILLMTG